MRYNPRILLFIFAIVLAGKISSYAQNVAACNAPQTICSNPSFTFTSVTGFGLPAGLNVSNPAPNPQAVGNGTNYSGPGNAGCMFNNVPNPQWLLINITSTGTLGFSFGPAGSANPQTAFMHWIMWPYNANTCTGIFNNTLPPVACNYNCATSGGTGMGPPPPSGSACNFQPPINVLQGEQYLILISNGSGIVKPVTFSVTGSAGVSCNPFTINSVTACPNQQAVATATWLGASSVTYSIYSINSGGVPMVQSSPNFTVANASTSIYTVVANGLNSFNQPITATQQFTLNIIQTQPLTVAYDTNYCYGSTITFTPAPSTGTFVVSGPGVSSPPYITTFVNSNPTFTNAISPGMNGMWTINASFTTGCIGQQTLQVNIAPPNYLSVNNNTGASNACLNGTANMTASLTTALSYTWTGPNNYSVVAQSPSIPNVQMNQAGIYTVQANINYNTIACPQQNTLQLNVIQTHTIDAVPSFTYCQGVPASLTASAAGNPQSYSWTGPGGFSSNQQNPIITGSIMPTDAGNYIVTALFTNGSNLSCPVTAISNVSVVAINPVFVFTPTLICQYATANLGATAQGALSYSWTGPNNFKDTVASVVIPNIQPAASGIYTVNVVYGIGTRTCPAVGYGQLTVVNVDSVSVNSPTPVCRPQNVSLMSYANGASSYLWTGPNSFTANTNNVTLFYPPLNATGIYTVVATFSNVGITCFNTNTVYVSVNPVMSFTLPPPIQACYGTSITVNGPVGATSYTWTSSIGYTSTTQDLILTALSPTQTGNYVLSVSLGPCVSTRTVDLNVLTPIQFSLTPQSREICRGDTVLLEVGSTGGSQNYAYDWTPANYLSAPHGSVVTGILAGTTVFNVIAHDLACPAYTISNAFTILVKQPPMPNLVLDKTEGCDPMCVYLDSQIQDTVSAIITYDFGGLLKFQGDKRNFCLPGPGTYNLRVLSEGTNGCIGVYNYPSPIVVNPKADVDITWTPEVPNTTDNLVTFNPVPRKGNVVFYNWMFAGTGVSGYDTTTVKHPQRKYESNGHFPIMLITTTDKNCTDTTIKFIDIRDELIVFIPNTFTPNNDGLNDQFIVKGLGFKTESFTLEIFDRWGHSVFTTKDMKRGWDGTVKGQAPEEGVYVYKVNVIGLNGEGRQEYVGHVTLLK